MVVYAFLCDPELINAPYREIAATADVAVGTVGWILNGLKAANFVGEKGKKSGDTLTSYRGLLDRRVEACPEKSRPKPAVGQFATGNPLWWKDIDIQKYNGYRGREITTAKYTNYLKPKVATVYLPEDELNRFLRDARLRKVTNWLAEAQRPVDIYRPFWPR